MSYNKIAHWINRAIYLFRNKNKYKLSISQLQVSRLFMVNNYRNLNELLNKRSELISKCHHASKFLLSNYKSND